MHQQILASLLTLLSFFYLNSSDTDDFSRGLKFRGLENLDLENLMIIIETNPKCQITQQSCVDN